MTFKKYIKPILVFLPVAIFFIVAFFFALIAEQQYYKTDPFDRAGPEISYVFIWIILASIIGGVFFGYILGPLYLLIHKKILGIKLEYGIQERPIPTTFKGYFKALFPSLMAINFAMLFTFQPWVQDLTIALDKEDPRLIMLTFLILTPLMMGISMALFSGVWFLLDSGIVYTNRKRVLERKYPIEVRSVGGWYLYLLKGYAGISVILTFYTFITNIFTIVGRGGEIHWSLFVSLIPFPIFLSIFALPAVIILDMTTKFREKYILNIAKKMGISNPLKDPLNIQLIKN